MYSFLSNTKNDKYKKYGSYRENFSFPNKYELEANLVAYLIQSGTGADVKYEPFYEKHIYNVMVTEKQEIYEHEKMYSTDITELYLLNKKEKIKKRIIICYDFTKEKYFIVNNNNKIDIDAIKCLYEEQENAIRAMKNARIDDI